MKLRPQTRPVVGVQDGRCAMNLTRFELLPRSMRLSTRLVLEPRDGEPDGQPFERVEAMGAETSVRVRSLRGYSSICDLKAWLAEEAVAARALADALEASTSASMVANLASPYFMRRLRNAFGSHLIAVVECLPQDTAVHVCTIIVSDWSRTSKALRHAHRNNILKGLQTRLYERGLAELSGWCAFALHGEFRRGTGCFDLHFHGVIVGDKVKAFEELSSAPMFAGGDVKAIRTPVRIAKLENPVRQLSYILQGFWPLKYRSETPGADNGLRRRRRRIPEPHHAEYLLWLSRQTLSDLVWLHGVTITNGRFEATSR